MDGFTEEFAKTGTRAKVVGEAPLFDVFFTGGDVRDYRSMIAGDRDMTLRFNQLIRQRGIFKGDSKFYISMAHTEGDIKLTLDAVADALNELNAAA